MEDIQRYNKAIVAVLTAFVAGLPLIGLDIAGLDEEWAQSVALLLGPILVYFIPNKPMPETEVVETKTTVSTEKVEAST